MGSRGGEDSRQGGGQRTWAGEAAAGGADSPTIACGKIYRNNWGMRQTEQPQVPVRGNKASKPLTENTCGG